MSLYFVDDQGTLVAVAGGGGSIPADATTITKGIVQLAGDLAGTAAAPTVPGLATKADTTYAESLAGLNAETFQTGTSYTFVLADAHREVDLSNAGAITLTMPTNASVPFPLGTVLKFRQWSTGTVTVVPAGGVTVDTPPFYSLSLAGAKATGFAVKRDTNHWVMFGHLLPSTPTANEHLTRKDYVDTQDATKVPTTRTIAAGTGLTGGGDLSANRTLSVDFGSTSTTVSAGNHTHTAAGLGTRFSSGGSAMVAATSKAFAATNSMIFVPVWIPVATTLTGIRYRKGTGTVAANVIGALYDSGGTRVANSATVAQGTTASAVVTCAFTGTYAAAAGLYYVGVIGSSTSADFYGYATNEFLGPATIATQGSFTTPASFTPPGATTLASGNVPFVTTY